jgi:hypothetical protein
MDILLPISFLASRVQAPTEQDKSKLHRVYQYLNRYPKLFLRYKKNVKVIAESFIDASFGCHYDGTSRTGVVLIICGVVIGVYTMKQKLVSKSATESEIIGLSDGLNNVLWMRMWLESQGYDVGPMTVWQDNKAVLALIERGGASQRTRHINVRYFFASDRVKSGEIVLKHKPTAQMLADIFTKPLIGNSFRSIRDAMMGA